MQPALIHLEHALPPLSELGLEHLIPALMQGGGKASIDADSISAILQGLANGAQKHAARQLVAVARASAEDLLLWEVDAKTEAEAFRRAALSTPEEAKRAVLGFFSSLGLSLDVIPVSLEPETENPENEDKAETPAES
jgi:hypothetical protein